MFFLLSFATEDDKAKFDLIYHRYKKLLLSQAYSILHDPQLCEDAVSEAFIRIYKNLDKVADPCSNQSVSFYVTIAKNRALTLLQKQNKMPVVFEDTQTPDELNVEEDVLAKLSGEKILSLVNSLKEEWRSVFLLKYGHNLSHKEIAALQSISENNVTVRLHRAKKELCAILEKEGYPHEK